MDISDRQHHRSHEAEHAGPISSWSMLIKVWSEDRPCWEEHAGLISAGSVQDGCTKLFFDGQVRPYTADPCALAFSQEVCIAWYVFAEVKRSMLINVGLRAVLVEKSTLVLAAWAFPLKPLLGN